MSFNDLIILPNAETEKTQVLQMENLALINVLVFFAFNYVQTYSQKVELDYSKTYRPVRSKRLSRHSNLLNCKYEMDF